MAACHRISIDTPGVAYVVGETGRPERVRAGHITDAAIKDVAARYAAPHRRPITVPESERTSSSKGKRAGKNRTRRETDDADDKSSTATQDGPAQQAPGGEAA